MRLVPKRRAVYRSDLYMLLYKHNDVYSIFWFLHTYQDHDQRQISRSPVPPWSKVLVCALTPVTTFSQHTMTKANMGYTILWQSVTFAPALPSDRYHIFRWRLLCIMGFAESPKFLKSHKRHSRMRAEGKDEPFRRRGTEWNTPRATGDGKPSETKEGKGDPFRWMISVGLNNYFRTMCAKYLNNVS